MRNFIINGKLICNSWIHLYRIIQI